MDEATIAVIAAVYGILAVAGLRLLGVSWPKVLIAGTATAVLTLIGLAVAVFGVGMLCALEGHDLNGAQRRLCDDASADALRWMLVGATPLVAASILVGGVTALARNARSMAGPTLIVAGALAAPIVPYAYMAALASGFLG